MVFQKERLGKLLSKVGSGVTPKGGSDSYVSQGVPLIRSQNVLWGKLSTEGIAFIDAQQHAKMSGSFVMPNDVLLNITGASIGRACVVPSCLGEANVNQHVCILRAGDKLDSEYLSNFLISQQGQREIALFQAGGNREGLNYEQVRSFEIPLPPLAEQRKIAEILRTWDEAIETAEAELKAKQERKRWLMQAVLSGSLRLKGCNKAWEKKRLDQVGTIVPGGTPSTSIPEYWNGDVPWVTPTEISKLKTPYIYDTEALITSEGVRNSSAALLPADSLIVCTRATVGVCAINKVPMTTNQGFKSVVPESIDDTLFLYYVLNSMQSTFNRLAQGSTFLEISKTQFEKITIIWPSADERRLIASLMRTCDEQIESIGEAIEVLRAQKRGLMQKLLTGEVRVAA
jgi:type I restriction enzyme, S subunit